MADDEMLTYQGAASLLGLKIGTLYSMTARKQIPYVRLGPRLVRFSRAALEQWLRERSVVPEATGAAR
jgi:excisionase family DNA binding protein